MFGTGGEGLSLPDVGRGRGRNLVLPAWMKDPSLVQKAQGGGAATAAVSAEDSGGGHNGTTEQIDAPGGDANGTGAKESATEKNAASGDEAEESSPLASSKKREEDPICEDVKRASSGDSPLPSEMKKSAERAASNSRGRRGRSDEGKGDKNQRKEDGRFSSRRDVSRSRERTGRKTAHGDRGRRGSPAGRRKSSDSVMSDSRRDDFVGGPSSSRRKRDSSPRRSSNSPRSATDFSPPSRKQRRTGSVDHRSRSPIDHRTRYTADRRAPRAPSPVGRRASPERNDSRARPFRRYNSPPERRRDYPPSDGRRRVGSPLGARRDRSASREHRKPRDSNYHSPEPTRGRDRYSPPGRRVRDRRRDATSASPPQGRSNSSRYSRSPGHKRRRAAPRGGERGRSCDSAKGDKRKDSPQLPPTDTSCSILCNWLNELRNTSPERERQSTLDRAESLFDKERLRVEDARGHDMTLPQFLAQCFPSKGKWMKVEVSKRIFAEVNDRHSFCIDFEAPPDSDSPGGVTLYECREGLFTRAYMFNDKDGFCQSSKRVTLSDLENEAPYMTEILRYLKKKGIGGTADMHYFDFFDATSKAKKEAEDATSPSGESPCSAEGDRGDERGGGKDENEDVTNVTKHKDTGGDDKDDESDGKDDEEERQDDEKTLA